MDGARHKGWFASLSLCFAGAQRLQKFAQKTMRLIFNFILCIKYFCIARKDRRIGTNVSRSL